MKEQEKPLKVLAFSDLHGNEKALDAISKKAGKADILVCAGDITVFENKILHLMRKLDRIGKTVLMVQGNHEDPMLLAEICGKLSNVKMLHRKVYADKKFPRHVFIGHGGEGFSTASGDFERFAAKYAAKLRQLQKQGKKLVLITHQPPYGTKVDFIWAHHGNKSYTKFIRKMRPALAICGHLHETEGKKDRIGKTLIINPGPKGRFVEIA